ncbi:MAG: Qat anti-phage system TatD family nuclease QatD [Bacteroidota bacterium]
MTTVANGFDFHCHVDLFPDPVALIAECDRSRILTVAVTTTPKAWVQNRHWTERSTFVIPAIGLHPELAGQRHGEIALLEQLMAETPFVGEIGLDGSPLHRKTLPIQKEVFSRALQSAQRLGGRVLTIHSRRAGREVLASLAEHTTLERVLPILHWFSDGVATALEAARFGCYFSINHRMLIAEKGIVLIKGLPADRLLTETDAPFTEIENRKSEPRDVTAIISRLAQVRNLDVEEMRQIVEANAQRVLEFAHVNIPIRPTA